MFSKRRQDKDDVYINTMEYCSATKKNEIMPFAATWNDLKIGILNEVSQTKKEILYFSHMESKKKKDRNELIWKTDSQIQRRNLWLGEGDREFGKACTHCYI